MKLEDFIGSDVFWTAVASLVALSVAVGSAVTIGINSWVKRREQPSAEWAVDLHGGAHHSDAQDTHDGISVQGTLSNVGDGRAFRLTLETRHCTAVLGDTHGMQVSQVSHKAYMPPGAILTLHVRMGLDDWDKAKVKLFWTPPPTRLGKRNTFDLSPKQFMDEPRLALWAPNEGMGPEVPASEFGALRASKGMAPANPPIVYE